MFVYIDKKAEQILKKHNIQFLKPTRKTPFKTKKVLAVPVFNLSNFENLVRYLEKITLYRIPLYNADIKPEQMFLYENKLKPCSQIILKDNKVKPIKQEYTIPLTKLDLNLENNKIKFNNKTVSVEEFVEKFQKLDPDVIRMDYAYARLPLLAEKLRKNNLSFSFHRWDSYPIKYKGGKSFYSYGNVRYQNYSIKLNGRFLIDNSTMVGNICSTEAIAELSRMTGTRFQTVASRSFGAAFQSALIKEMINDNYLVPYKEKPIDKPINMFHLLKADRGAHTFDPKIGFHKNVAEVDFSSMFPWLIYNHNISAETLLSEKGPFDKVPDLPIKASLRFKGLVPRAIKPLLDKRMQYKKIPSSINKAKARGLKWVLVTSYGYLRFREFKLGLPSSHMAICAYARETLLKSAKLAEEYGFEVVHGIVDSLFIKKKNIKEKEVREFCKELQTMTGIPVGFKGIFNWVVFLASVNDPYRPLPSTYFGVFRNREIKARGIELRKRNTPEIVKKFQKSALKIMGECTAEDQIKTKISVLINLLKKTIENLDKYDAALMACSITISKTDYKNNIPQKYAIKSLRKKGIIVKPGQHIHYIITEQGVVLPEDYNKNPDIAYYKKLLVKSLYVLLQQFGYTKQDIKGLIEKEKQTTIKDFVKCIYIPIKKTYAEKRGLSEKLIKKRLEKQGWEVWKGSLINILRKDNYPNVQKKYSKLIRLLKKHHPEKLEHLKYICDVHHGMPDFICYRNKFKFVECKLDYEPLRESQKKTIILLKKMGLKIEIHKLVEKIKTRVSLYNPKNNKHKILEKQLKLTKKLFNSK
ncbi:MAG: DNA polymerase [Candidatus Woesearchaeota archaeon]|nr:DNA polymerase [Candidatus Woesearchaeota archaeon]